MEDPTLTEFKTCAKKGLFNRQNIVKVRDNCMMSNKKSETLGKSLHDMSLSGELCDITLRIGTSSIKAHKIILIANSDYFKAMFSHQFTESVTSVVSFVDNPDFTYDAVMAVVEFAYTGQLPIDLGTVYGILQVGQHWLMQDVMDVCECFLESLEMNATNCITIFKIALVFNLSFIKEKCMEIFSRNLNILYSSDEILDVLDGETLVRLLKNTGQGYFMNLGLVEFIVKWIDYCPEEREAWISTCLEEINLLWFNNDELDIIVNMGSGCIKNDEGAARQVSDAKTKLDNIGDSSSGGNNLVIISYSQVDRFKCLLLHLTILERKNSQDSFDRGDSRDGVDQTSGSQNRDIREQDISLPEPPFTRGYVLWQYIAVENTIYFLNNVGTHRSRHVRVVSFDVLRTKWVEKPLIDTSEFSCPVDFNHVLLVSSGREIYILPWEALTHFFIYNIDTNELSLGPDMRRPITRNVAYACVNDKLYACGGRMSSPFLYLMCIDGEAKPSTERCPSTMPLLDCHYLVTGHGYIFRIGQGSGVVVVHCYSPTGGVWFEVTKDPDVNTLNLRMQDVLSCGDSIYVIGVRPGPGKSRISTVNEFIFREVGDEKHWSMVELSQSDQDLFNPYGGNAMIKLPRSAHILKGGDRFRSCKKHSDKDTLKYLSRF